VTARLHPWWTCLLPGLLRRHLNGKRQCPAGRPFPAWDATARCLRWVHGDPWHQDGWGVH
jgi:hypothetical protein